ncbi:MAG TPA: hypothetical protein PK239_03345 [Chitinophagales bacterium]|nr:hypothetical protein [Chitinophagales bacterium]
MTPENLNYHKEILQKELALIQDVIKRMASNSFQVKAWTIALFSAIIAFSIDKLTAQNNQVMGIFTSTLLLVPILCFWYLDAFFLSTERLYRNIYKWVVQYRMFNKEAYLYDLNTFTRITKLADDSTKTYYISNHVISESEPVKASTLSLMFSVTLWRFYIGPLAFAIVLLGYNLFKYMA